MEVSYVNTFMNDLRELFVAAMRWTHTESPASMSVLASQQFAAAFVKSFARQSSQLRWWRADRKVGSRASATQDVTLDREDDPDEEDIYADMPYLV